MLGELDAVAVDAGGLRQQLLQPARQVLPAGQLARVGLALEPLDDRAPWSGAPTSA